MYDIRLRKEGCSDKLPVNRFVVPFIYDNFRFENENGFRDFITGLVTGGEWKPCLIHGKDNELYEHMDMLIAGDISNIDRAIGVSLEYAGKCGALLENIFTCDMANVNNCFSFTRIFMVLFKTKTGFLVLETDYSRFDTLTDIIECNNAVKSIKIDGLYRVETKTEFIALEDAYSSVTEDMPGMTAVRDDTAKGGENRFLYLRRDTIPAKDEDIQDLRVVFRNKSRFIKCKWIERKEFSYKTAVSSYLKDLNITTYFIQSYSSENKCSLPSKANFFGAVLIEYGSELEEEIKPAFFRYRKAYKNTYNPSREEKELVNNNEVYRPFEGSIWGVSREGAANLLHSDKFLSNGYASRLDTYFYLYLLVLHQYYGLLHLARDISSLPSTIDKYMDDEQHDRLMKIRDRINFFFLKCIYYEVSHITHQAVFYHRMVDVFGVRDMLGELQYEMDRVTGLIGQLREREQRRREKEQDEREKLIEQEKARTKVFFIMIGAIFTFVSTFEAIWSTISYAKGAGFRPFRIFADSALNEFMLVLFIQLLLCILGAAGYAVFRHFIKKKPG